MDTGAIIMCFLAAVGTAFTALSYFKSLKVEQPSKMSERSKFGIVDNANNGHIKNYVIEIPQGKYSQLVSSAILITVIFLTMYLLWCQIPSLFFE